MPQWHATSGRWQLGLALSLVTTTLWGSLPVALKLLLATMSPLTLTWYRYVMAGALLTAVLMWRGPWPAASRFRGAVVLLAIAAVGFAGNNVLFLAGLDRVGPSAAQVVIQLAPVMLILAGVLIFHEPFAAGQWLGVAVLLGGMALFFHRGLAAAVSSPGVLLIVLAAACWAAYAVAQKQLQRALPSLAVLWVAYGGGTILLLPAVAPSEARGLDGLGWVLLAYVGVNGVVAYGSFAEAMSHWEVSRVSAVLATTPLFTPVFSELAAWMWPGRFAHEGLDWMQLAGGALVAGGSVLAVLGRGGGRRAA